MNILKIEEKDTLTKNLNEINSSQKNEFLAQRTYRRRKVNLLNL